MMKQARPGIRLVIQMAELGTIIGLIKTFAPKADPEEIEQAVSDWLDDHPEATTTVEDGSITKAKLDSDLQDTVDDVQSLKTEINSGVIEENLLRSEMPGTSTTVTMDSNGNPTSIVHTANSETVRTDSFVWSTNSVVETRTLASGKYITITTNLETLAQTISAVQEVA